MLNLPKWLIKEAYVLSWDDTPLVLTVLSSQSDCIGQLGWDSSQQSIFCYRHVKHSLLVTNIHTYAWHFAGKKT